MSEREEAIGRAIEGAPEGLTVIRARCGDEKQGPSAQEMRASAKLLRDRAAGMARDADRLEQAATAATPEAPVVLDADGSMLCPYCGWFGLHFDGAPTKTKDDRGPVVSVRLKCEQGHVFDLLLRSHAGHMNFSTVSIDYDPT